MKHLNPMLRMLVLLLACAPSLGAQAPAAIFLTWSDDPTTTVTVDWHQVAGVDISSVEIRGPGISEWRPVEGQLIGFPHSSRTVRRALVRDLQPDALYELRVGESEIYRYRSMPSTLSRPVRFASGGDTRYAENDFGQMNRIVAAFDLDFVKFGGDLSYADGQPTRSDRKEQWFETVTRTLVGEGNRLIPVVVAIGNHEVWDVRRVPEGEDPRAFMSQWGMEAKQATYFRPLFAFPRGNYFDVLDFGDYLSLVALDSDHMRDVVGAQTDWLRETLAERVGRPHVIPFYHQPAYPSVRSFTGSSSVRIREHWVPLFEQFGVNLVFENHDHVYKRTVPLRGGEAHAEGIVFLGDGAWGVGVREIGRDQGGEPAWYLAEAHSENHGIVVTLDGRDRHIVVVTSDGRIIDELRWPAR